MPERMTGTTHHNEFYQARGWSARCGYGVRPALLVIDMCVGITKPSSRFFIPMDEQIPHIAALVQECRQRQVPVFYTTISYTPQSVDGMPFVRKIPELARFVPGSPLAEIDERLVPAPGDLVIVKRFASAFSGTHLHSLLTAARVDTTIVVGNSTSGCVRATAVDAISSGFNVIVPLECVADRLPLAHEVNLSELDAKYADVVTIKDVLGYLDMVQNGVANRDRSAS